MSVFGAEVTHVFCDLRIEKLLPKQISLPPLNGLRAFEAAGRRLNFRAAAEELGVTQGRSRNRCAAWRTIWA
jgi:hypothetical protein